MIEWIVTSCVLIAVVILIRFAFRRKLALRVRYALWLTVALRLLVPVTFFESSFSVLNLLPEGNLSDEAISEELQGNKGILGMGYQAVNTSSQGTDLVNVADNSAYNGDLGNAGGSLAFGGNMGEVGDNLIPGDTMGTAGGNVVYNGYQAPEVAGSEQELKTSERGSIFSPTKQDAGQVLFYIWLVGVLVSGVLILIVNISYGRRLCRSRVPFSGKQSDYLPGEPVGKQQGGHGRKSIGLSGKFQGNLPLYVSGAVKTPCLFGFLHPAIYLTPDAAKAPESLHYVLCHESVHYRHRDNFWSLVRTVCLCLHWYNPFVWLAAALSRQDGELACDEETVQWLGDTSRLDYGRALLEFCAKGHIPFHSITLATTMSGGKRKLRERLELIAKQPRKTAGALAAVVLIVMLLLAVTFTGRRVEQEDSLLVKAVSLEPGDEEDSEDNVSDGGAGSGNSGQAQKEADAPGDTEVTESVFGYTAYTGYLDECLQWSREYRQDFVNQDYDGDGLTDRVWREDTQDLERQIITATYRIEFGNGDVLEMDGLGDGLPHVRSVDLAGDGVPEILFTLSYDYSTDPTAFGEMALYEKTSEGYQWMELPEGMVKDPYGQGTYGERMMYQPTLTYHLEREGDHRLRINCLETTKEAPLDVMVTFDWETWELGGYDYYNTGEKFEKSVWKVEFEEREGELPRLLLHTGMLDKWCADDVVLSLVYRNGELHMEEIQYYQVYTEYIPIDLGDGKTYNLAVHGSTLLDNGGYNTDSGRYYTDSVALVWSHDNVGEWLEEIDFSEAARDFPDGNLPQLEAYSPDGGIRLMDLNFDGAQDLCIQAWVGSHNTPYYCFVWNKESERFQYMARVPNVELDQENRRIVSSTVDGGGQYSTSYYYLDENNRLVLERWMMEALSPAAVFDSLDLTYVKTDYSLPAIDNWDYEIYGGGLHDKMTYWAKQALTELYRWTGTKVETAYFTVTGFGNFVFARSEEDLLAGRTFYDRTYGSAAGFMDCIQGMNLATGRVVWFSPVLFERFPDNGNLLSDEEIVSWYFTEWANGETVDTIEQTLEDTFVIRVESGSYYELIYSADIQEVSSIYGPYPDYPQH